MSATWNATYLRGAPGRPSTPPPARSACLQSIPQEVTVDGIKVLSRSGPHSYEWRNRLRWMRDKREDYELHVMEDGVQVRLGEKTVWGVTPDHIMD